MQRTCCICLDPLHHAGIECQVCTDGKHCISCYAKLKCGCSGCCSHFACWVADENMKIVFNCDKHFKSCGICRNTFKPSLEHVLITKFFTLNVGATDKNTHFLDKLHEKQSIIIQKLLDDHKNDSDNEEYTDALYSSDDMIYGSHFFSIDHIDFLNKIDKPIAYSMSGLDSVSATKRRSMLKRCRSNKIYIKVGPYKILFCKSNNIVITLRDVLNFTNSWKFMDLSMGNYAYANTLDHRFLESVNYVGRNTIELGLGS